MINAVLQEPWWDVVKNEVTRTVTARIKAECETDKPHGSLLGDQFVLAMNQDSSIRKYVHYLLTRKWSEIMDDLKGDLSPPVRKALLHAQGEAWFSEFKGFLARAWDTSVPKDPMSIFKVLDRQMFVVIRREWVRHVEAGAEPSLLANVMLEWMRSQDLHDVRRSAVNASAFMAVRSWSEVLSALRTHEAIRDPLKDLEGLDSPEAEMYYNEWKAVVLAAVNEYWDELKDESQSPENDNSENA